MNYTNWYIYVDEHIRLAYSLHNISEIVIVEHEKCGAYAAQYGEITREEEYNCHLENATICTNTLWDKFNPINGTDETKIPNLVIIAYIISIDGCTLTEIIKRSS